MRKLELNEVAPYLPYGLQIKVNRLIYPKRQEVIELTIGALASYFTSSNFIVKPLLIPLSEFNDSEADTEIFNIGKAYTSVKLNQPSEFPYWQFEILVK